MIFNARDEDNCKALCGPDKGYDDSSPVLRPSAWFSADGNYLFTQTDKEKPAVRSISISTLSKQIWGRTCACLTATQREQFLAETTSQARAAYVECMAALGYAAP